MIILMIVLGRAGGRFWFLNSLLSRCDPHGNKLVFRLNDLGHIGLIDNSALVIYHGLGDCEKRAGGERS